MARGNAKLKIFIDLNDVLLEYTSTSQHPGRLHYLRRYYLFLMKSVNDA